jgi:ADP-heptose:LPS heptosyltransferase
MRILCLIPGGIGEQILFFPTLKDLKQQYPNAAIDVVVEPTAKAAYRVCQDVNDTIVFDYKDRNSLADYLNILGVIRDREYDVAITLSNRWTLGLLLWLNGIPVRIGYRTNNFAWILSNSIELKSEQYTAYMYHDLLQGLGIGTPCPEVKITVPKPDITWAEAQQKRLDIKEAGYILISDNRDRDMDDVYPISQWKQIVRDIQSKQPSVSVVLLQTSEDKTQTKSLLQAFPDLKAIEPSDVGKLAATIAGANLLLCTDNASMQLSVAVGTYTIALFDRVEVNKLLPPNSDRYIGIRSSSGKIADIKPETVLDRIWRG